MIDATTPGQRLKLARITKKLRQTAVAEHMDTTASRVSEWEAGKHMPSAGNLERLADLYGVTTRWILTGEEPDELTENVSRGTRRMPAEPGAFRVTVAPTRELRVMALRFEAEAIEMGADDSDMDHVKEVLRSAAESTMGARGHQELNPADARAEMELHIAMLREWLRGRLERRKRLTPPR